MRWSRIGALRSSREAARRANSLRSNKGASSAASRCGARLALRLKKAKATAEQKRIRAGELLLQFDMPLPHVQTTSLDA